MKFDTNVPVPMAYRNIGATKKYKSMRPGESFFISDAEDRGGKRLRSSVYQFMRYYPLFKLVLKTTEEEGVKGIRVWCVENPDFSQTGGKAGNTINSTEEIEKAAQKINAQETVSKAVELGYLRVADGSPDIDSYVASMVGKSSPACQVLDQEDEG